MNDTPKTKCTAAIYARVSTKDKGQAVENQLIQLRDYSQRQGWQCVEYIDHASGKTGDRDAFKEAHFRTTGMAGELMLAISAWIAKQERLRITDRVNAGIRRARLNGTRSGSPIGRPRAVFDRARVVEMRNAGRSWRQIATVLGISTGTARTVFNSGVQKPSPERAVAAGASMGVAVS
jgi:DNA invertase Pin-like site-specific DNA recombinase